jgi:hypothetical protein
MGKDSGINRRQEINGYLIYKKTIKYPILPIEIFL